MTADREQTFTDNVTAVVAAWLNAIQEVLTNHSDACYLEKASSNSIRLSRAFSRGTRGSQEFTDAGALEEITAAIVIDGRLCTFFDTPTYSMSGKLSGTYNVFATNNGTNRAVAIEAIKNIGPPTT